MDSRADKFITSVLKYEGGYTADQDDSANAGGYETYRGISRKNFPSWEGWKIVDQHKPLKTNQIISSTSLENMVKDFYYKNFYLKMSIQKINNTLLAAHTMDHGVNAGIKNGIKILQKAINKVTNAGITVDGIIGNATLGYANGGSADAIAKEIGNQRKNYYRNLVNSKPSYSKFLNGWLKRVDKVNTEYGSVLGEVLTSVIIKGDSSKTETETKKENEMMSGSMIRKATNFLSVLAEFFNTLLSFRK